LAIDAMFINKIPTSLNIHFGTAELVKDMKNNTLVTSIEQLVQVYQTRGFKIQAILTDGQFQHIQQIIEQIGIRLNICAANEHVPEIERYIRTVKERVRSIATTLPFKRYPPRLIVKMVYNCIFWFNSFPHKDGVLATISPRAIMTGKKSHTTNIVNWSLVHMYKHTKTQQLHGVKNIQGYSFKTIWKRTRGTLFCRPTHRKEDPKE